MSTSCVVGLQWGDEGKGKIVDILAEEADIVVRFQGGSNAGHTVVVDGEKFVLHMLPSGILREECISVLGNGVVIDPVQFVQETEELAAKGVAIDGKLLISDRAQVVMPYHKRLDAASEEARGEDSIGTTLRGIGPCYMDKVGRNGVRLADLLDPGTFRRVLERSLPTVNRFLHGGYGAEEIRIEDIFEEYCAFGQKLKPFVGDVARVLHQKAKEGAQILFEGAQGCLLDLDYGTYPFVTSSNTTSAAAATGTGFPANRLEEVIGVAKAYTTRVGQGAFPTELTGEEGDRLRETGGEYGATTGRPRRCGWFDAIVTGQSAMISGTTSLAITKLDVLDNQETIKVCVAYQLNGQEIDAVPASIELFERCEPVYKEFPGWMEKTSHLTKYEDLPTNARNYIQALSDLVEVQIGIVSVGRDRRHTIRVAE